MLRDVLPRLSWLATVSLLLVAAGCQNKCDELVSVLTECVSGEVGAEETTETEEEPGDAECSSEDTSCSTCILESKMDLCVDYGKALQACRDAGECE